MVSLRKYLYVEWSKPGKDKYHFCKTSVYKKPIKKFYTAFSLTKSF